MRFISDSAKITQNQLELNREITQRTPNVHRRYTQRTPNVHPGSSVGSPQGALGALRWRLGRPSRSSPPNVFFFREKKSACTFFSPDRGDCRSRKMLKNECLVAKIGVDTAENEPSKVSGASEFHREFHIRIPPAPVETSPTRRSLPA